LKNGTRFFSQKIVTLPTENFKRKENKMALQCGIVGLPNVGKSTLFNCLSNARAQSANFPFCTIEPNVGVITVPDKRLIELEKIDNPKRVVPTTVEIVDIAGLVKGASKGEGLGNQFLANIREVDAIIHVLRCFENDNITHVDGSIDPVRDKEVIDTELQLKDLETVENRIARLQKQARVGMDKAAMKALAVAEKLKASLESGISVRAIELTDDEKELIHDFFLLTDKPVLYVCNVDEASAASGNAFTEKVKENIANENAEILIIAAATEADIAELETYEEKQLFLEDLGLDEPGVNKLIHSAYRLLNLQTYFTTGADESRAWTFKEGTKAPGAAGIIHTDFEKGFIRAEVIKYDDYVRLGSEAACRDAGKIAVEGKEYVVQDGDIMHFRFNV
jgi:ribosome-binding ATPase